MKELINVLCAIGSGGRKGSMGEGITRDIYPLIDHPHNDIENGQPEQHYHGDERFNVPQTHLPKDWKVWANAGRIPIDSKGNIINNFGAYDKVWLEMVELFKSDELSAGMTDLNLITKSKLKHKCIHKGKCPHRGFDLSNEPIKNGVITCPLHSLQFDGDSGKLLTDMSKIKTYNERI